MNENSFDSIFFLSLCGLICTSTTLLIRYCYKSKCSQIEICCIKVTRNIELEIKQDLELGESQKNIEESKK
jgi:hypothetical protein